MKNVDNYRKIVLLKMKGKRCNFKGLKPKREQYIRDESTWEQSIEEDDSSFRDSWYDDTL